MLSRSRTIGVMAHVDAGKTTVSERMLVLAGRLRHAGDIDAGNTHLDTLPEERSRGITISAAATSFTWTPRVGLGAGESHAVQLIDTPGHVDFGVEVERALSVLDGAVLVLDAHKGVEPQTEAVWRQAERHGVPRIAFANKMDKPGADWAGCLRSVSERLGARPLPVAWPIGAGAGFDGVIDLRTGEALRFSGADGRDLVVEAAPAVEGVAEARAALVEALAEHDDAVMAAWVEGHTPPVDAMDRALRAVVRSGAWLPVLPGAALQDIGVQPLLDAVAQWLPAPGETRQTAVDADPDGPLAALVFKSVVDRFVGALAWVRVRRGRLERGDTVVAGGRRARVGRILRLDGAALTDIPSAELGDVVAVTGLGDLLTGDAVHTEGHPVSFPRIVLPEPVIEVVVEARRRADQDRLTATLRRYAVEDPSLRLGVDPESGQTLLRGQGELHLDVLLTRARRELGVELSSSAPRVAWRETPVRAARVLTRHVRQNGGSGTFAVVELSVAPGEPGSGFVFRDETVGGALPAAYVAAVEKGAREAAETGSSAPVVDVIVTVHDGQTHTRDSSAQAFEQAGALAFAEALAAAGVVLLEPRVEVEVSVPEASLGAVLGDLAARGADIHEVGTEIRANVALRRMFGYVATLRGLSKGRGQFTLRPAGYAPAPSGARMAS